MDAQKFATIMGRANQPAMADRTFNWIRTPSMEITEEDIEQIIARRITTTDDPTDYIATLFKKQSIDLFPPEDRESVRQLGTRFR